MSRQESDSQIPVTIARDAKAPSGTSAEDDAAVKEAGEAAFHWSMEVFGPGGALRSVPRITNSGDDTISVTLLAGGIRNRARADIAARRVEGDTAPARPIAAAAALRAINDEFEFEVRHLFMSRWQRFGALHPLKQVLLTRMLEPMLRDEPRTG